MKKILIALILILATFSANAQKKDKNAIAPMIPYDSLSNFLGEAVASYTGQELFLKALPLSSQELGYPGFILKYKNDNDLLNDEKNIYKCCDGYNSRYIDLAGKHFHVIEVIKHPKAKKNEEEYKDEFYLKLNETSSGDQLYYKYNTDSEYTFPFVVMGYYEKQKQLYTGKEYIFANEIVSGLKDIATGKAIPAVIGQKWKCTDLIIDKRTGEMRLIIENPKKQKSQIPFEEIIDNAEVKKVYTAAEAASYTKKFNSYNFNRILQRKIRAGMTTEMCRMAWGNPIDIKETGSGGNKTTTWIYPSGTISFRNNKAVKIN